MNTIKPIPSFLAVVCILAGAPAGVWVNEYLSQVFFLLAAIIAMSLKMAHVWQTFVILRRGKLQSVKGAGLFAIIPVLDNVVAVIDGRIRTTAFDAEQALPRDTAPVDVDTIIFWQVHDAEKAALAITDYREAIDRVAQTSLREMIGSSMLAALLSDRQEADQHLKEEIGRTTAPWGNSVSSVEIRGVAVPVALQLRAMNIIYETTKERGATIPMPSSMVDSLNPSPAVLALALAAKDPRAPEAVVPRKPAPRRAETPAPRVSSPVS